MTDQMVDKDIRKRVNTFLLLASAAIFALIAIHTMYGANQSRLEKIQARNKGWALTRKVYHVLSTNEAVVLYNGVDGRVLLKPCDEAQQKLLPEDVVEFEGRDDLSGDFSILLWGSNNPACYVSVKIR